MRRQFVLIAPRHSAACDRPTGRACTGSPLRPRPQMVRDLEAPGEGTHVSMWQDMANLLVKVFVMAAGVRAPFRCSQCLPAELPPAKYVRISRFRAVS